MEERETSVDRSLKILLLLASSAEGMTVSEISEELGYPDYTVVRLLRTLRRSEFVWQGKRRGPYKAGYRILELAGKLLSNMEIRQAARPYLHELASQTGYIAQLKVPSGIDAVVVDIAIPPLALPLQIDMGSRMRMHDSSLGRAILAFRSESELFEYIEEADLKSLTPYANTYPSPEACVADMRVTRARGYAIRWIGDPKKLHSIAAPVLRFDGRVIGAIGAGFGFGLRVGEGIPAQREQSIANEVVIAARRTSFALGYHANNLAG